MIVSSKYQEARENREQIVSLVEQTAQNFLDIGKLLKECNEKKYWSILGYKSFRDYVNYLNFPGVNSYTWATRVIGIYEMSTNQLAPPREEFIRIGVSKLSRFLPLLRKGTLTRALLDKAATLSDKELRHELGHNVTVSKSSWQRMSQTHDVHKDIQNKIEEIGKILGRYTKSEYRTRLYRYDVVWKEAQRVSHVFEIQAGGDVDTALSKLKDAYYNMGQPNLLLIVASQEDRSRAEQLISVSGDNEFNAAILLINAEEIDEIYKSVTLNPEIFRKLFTK
jgi:hypothetical protein